MSTVVGTNEALLGMVAKPACFHISELHLSDPKVLS